MAHEMFSRSGYSRAVTLPAATTKRSWQWRTSGRCLAVCGLVILVFVGPAFAREGSFSKACNVIVGEMLETSFGALVAAAAGLGAIIASAVGGFRVAWSLLVVSIACFILRALISLTWAPEDCRGVAGGGGGNPVVGVER